MSALGERVTTSDTSDDVAYDRSGPGTPAGRYLRRYWTPVAEIVDVAPGRGKTIEIMNERFTLYRGASGTPHLLAHLCAHRGTGLGTGEVEGECIRCFYHGWLYDGNGQCVEQPAEDESFAEKVRVRAYPTREYLGLVWSYLGEGEPPAFPKFDLFDASGVATTYSYFRKSNYFNSLENSCDWIHPFFVHARSAYATLGVNREIPKVSAEETDYGLAAYQRYNDGKSGVTFILMPLGMYILSPRTEKNQKGEERILLVDHIAFRIPIDDYSHRSFVLNFAAMGEEEAKWYREQQEKRGVLDPSWGGPEIVEKILRGEMHVNEVDLARKDIIGIQDAVVMENQPPMSDRNPDRLGRSDGPVILLRRIFTREIRAFAAGQPTKAWVWPRDLRAVQQI